MKKDFSNDIVPIPSSNKDISYVKRGKYTYVAYEFGKVYSPSKGLIPKRSIIGRVCTDDPTKMHPHHPHYAFFFPSDPLPDYNTSYHNFETKIGSFVAINKVVNSYNLREILQRNLPMDSGLCLDMAAHYIADHLFVRGYYEYEKEHPLFTEDMVLYNRDEIQDYLSSVHSSHIDRFLSEWGGETARQRCVYITYNAADKNIPEEEEDEDEENSGWGRDDYDIKTNFALGYDRHSRLPLFFIDYGGYMRSAEDLEGLTYTAEDWGYKKFGFLLDPVHFSEENVKYLDENNLEFLSMVDGTDPLVASLVEANFGFETDPANKLNTFQMFGETVYGTTVTARIFPSDTKKRWVHLYFNPAKRSSDLNMLQFRLNSYKDFFTTHRGSKAKFQGVGARYFDFQYAEDRTLVGAVEKTDVVNRDRALCGFFCLVTSERMTTRNALWLYRDMRASSHRFRYEPPPLFHDDDDFSYVMEDGINLVAFLATIIGSKLEYLRNNASRKLKNRPKTLETYFSLAKLDEMTLVKMRNPNASTFYILENYWSKEVQEVMKLYGLTSTDVNTCCTEIVRSFEISDKNHGEFEYYYDEDYDPADDKDYILQW